MGQKQGPWQSHRNLASNDCCRKRPLKRVRFLRPNFRGLAISVSPQLKSLKFLTKQNDISVRMKSCLFLPSTDKTLKIKKMFRELRKFLGTAVWRGLHRAKGTYIHCHFPRAFTPK